MHAHRFRFSATVFSFAAWTTLILIAATPPASAAGTGTFALRPGHLYQADDDGIFEYDAQLNHVGTLDTPLFTTLGLAFTAHGTILTSGFLAPGGTQHVLELSATGQVLRQRDLGLGGAFRGTHIDIDALGRIYLATEAGLAEIAGDFGSHRFISSFSFERPSGVVVGPDQRVYLSDQETSWITSFTYPDRVPIPAHFSLGLIAGLDVGADAALYVCAFNPGELRRIELDSGAQTTVVPGLHRVIDIAFAPDGTYYLAVENGSQLQHRSADHQLLGLASSVAGGDSLAVFPEPSSAAAVATLPVLMALRCRRRRRDALQR